MEDVQSTQHLGLHPQIYSMFISTLVTQLFSAVQDNQYHTAGFYQPV